MARKNSKAGQPNRGAQSERRAVRRERKIKYHPYRSHPVVHLTLGPGSENSIPSPVPGDNITREVYLVRELVSA